MTACIYYHPEAYTTAAPKLMGRNAAGESFLRGYLLHGKTGQFHIQVERPEHAEHFKQTARAHGRAEAVHVIGKNTLGELDQAGLMFYPGPVIGDHAWQRALFGHDRWSLCGITHTTSSDRAMDALANLVVAPLQPWDALICTSAAVKDNVKRLLQAQLEYLTERLGASKAVLPQLPVIPLGIHCGDFEFSDVQKDQARRALGADDDTLVVLFFGRLSFHGKAHPLAMYQALERAARTTDKKLVLIECGWHANDFIQGAFADAAQLACPSVRVVTLDGRKDEHRQTAWAGADVFCSLSDNIQETFGIAPIEAMAAGLPLVVSDWDGYRDTVRDGIDGFRVPTTMPHAGLGGDLSRRHALEIDTYDLYCGYACALVAVDIEATTAAFEKLFASSALRASMGAAARQRARAEYDWAVIIPRYEALWAELATLRRAASGASKSLKHPWPARLDPFDGFGSYPTRVLTRATLLALVDGDAATAVEWAFRCKQLAMFSYAKVVLPADDEIAAVLQAAAVGPRPAGELLAAIPQPRQAYVLRALAWLMKIGVLRAVGQRA